MKRVLTVFGTRPEAIKMAPLVKSLAQQDDLESKVCVTGQHREMLDQVLALFDIQPDFDLDLMHPDQNLATLLADALRGVDKIIQIFKPDLLIVQGDTTSTLAAAQAAFYRHIPVFHVEAGLRTGNVDSPWPEEANRKILSALATRHFVPTQGAANNLLQEGVASNTIYKTGNTVIDALYSVLSTIASNPKLEELIKEKFPFLKKKSPLILITAHRRENWGEDLENISKAIVKIANNFKNVNLIFPVHPNPMVKNPIHQNLGSLNNVFLVEPLNYLEFVFVMSQSTLILTDSGGVQEEAPALGKPLLLMRDHTERPEAIEANAMRIVGKDPETIFQGVHDLLNNDEQYTSLAQVRHLFGDGQSSQRIIQSIRQFLKLPHSELAIHG